MIPELGHFALILAFCLTLFQAVLPLIGASCDQTKLMSIARPAAIGQCLFAVLSFTALAYSFLSNDFSVAYVAANSNTHLPALYRFCAIWGAHEGSLLLWVLILSFWTAAVALLSRRLPLIVSARVLGVLGLVSSGFYLFLLTNSDPFTRLLPNFPTNGASLNPILQDLGLAIHPPILYMGYVGFSVAFAFAIAALLGGKLDATWARWTRPWTTVAWCFLTLGIVLGSWWAYRELGWGGWWFWDPVENASLLPWLAGTALLHALAVAEKRDVFKAWTVLLAVCAFSLSLLGTFLVRSGILISVHAFAVDPQRGLFLLRFLMIVVGASLALYAWRAKHVVNTGHFQWLSRESILLANNVLLFVAMATVLMGTLYPLIIAELQLGRISVGAPYFNAVFVPLMVPVLLLMGFAPYLQWQQTRIQDLIKSSLVTFVLVLLLAVTLPLLAGVPFQWQVCCGLLLSFWLILSTLRFCWKKKTSFISIKRLSLSQWAMVLAHVGVGVTAIGLVLTTAYSQQRHLSMGPGDQVMVGGYQFRFDGVQPLQGPDYTGYQATISVTKAGALVAVLHPQQRDFTLQYLAVAKTAIDAGIFRDLYVALGSSLGKTSWGVRIYYKPFVRWIWAGGLMMVLAGVLVLFDRRYRQRGA